MAAYRSQTDSAPSGADAAAVAASAASLEEARTRVDHIRAQLELSRVTSRIRRRKLTVPPTVIAVLGSVGGLALIASDMGTWGWRIYAGGVVGMSTSWLVVLPVLPVDERLVIGATYLMLGCNTLLAAIFLGLQAVPAAIRVFFVADCRVLYDAHANFARAAWQGGFHLKFVLYYAAGLLMWYRTPRLRVSAGGSATTTSGAASAGSSPVSPSRGLSGALPSADAITSRWMLRRLWKVFGAFYLTTGCGALFAIGVGVRYAPHFSRSWRFVGEMAVLLASIPLGSFFWVPGVLTRVQAWLAAGGESVHTAASIAALLSHGMKPDAAIRVGRERMHAIQAGRLTRDVFRTNAAENTWYARSVPADLEMVDAFVSHSWHDDADAKWIELQSWCAHFRDKHGRDPYLWIDKCCIDQSNIDAYLPCLPVFLAGCKQLLILAGPSYLERLWCIVELFVFVQMGGQEVHMGVLPGISAAEAEFGEAFDARGCKCFLTADYDRLLSCIEGACGTLDAFNDNVRGLLLSAPRAEFSALRRLELEAQPRRLGGKQGTGLNGSPIRSSLLLGRALAPPADDALAAADEGQLGAPSAQQPSLEEAQGAGGAHGGSDADADAGSDGHLPAGAALGAPADVSSLDPESECSHAPSAPSRAGSSPSRDSSCALTSAPSSVSSAARRASVVALRASASAHRSSATLVRRRRAFLMVLCLALVACVLLGGLLTVATWPAQRQCGACADRVAEHSAARDGRAYFAYRGAGGSAGAPRSWGDARAACAAEGRALAAVRSRAEAELAACACADAPLDGVWLGLRRPAGVPLGADNATRGWVWDTGARAVELDNWAPGEPRGDPSRPGCAVIGAAGRWEEAPCDGVALPFLCMELAA